MKGKSRVIQAVLLAVVLALVLALPTAAVEATGMQHVVQSGETLFRISLRYGVSVEALASTNGISNPNRIYVGQVLTIPGSAAPAAAAQPATSAPAAPATGAVHVVQRGEYLGLIAQRYGTSATAIAQANGLVNPSLIYVGQRLTIPGAAGTAAPAAPVAVPASSGTTTHIVQRGENLTRIGLRYGVSSAAIVQANGLANPSLIFAGQRLVIPAPGTAPGAAAGVNATVSVGKQIVVDLSSQMVYAFENGALVHSSLASTGLPATPTVQGNFSVYVKYESTTMSGPGYYLPGVPYTMYFYRGYGIHGTYWHNNFGRPMSHGCVNLPTSEAKWFFDWAAVGTPVRVQW